MDKNLFRADRSIILISFILFTFLAGCLPAQGQPTSSSIPVTQTSHRATTPTALRADTPTPSPLPTITTLPHLQVTPDSLNGTKIRFWHPYIGDTARVIRDITNEFNENNVWGIEVNINAAGSGGILYNQVMSGIEKGEIPNVVAAAPEQIKTWQTQKNVIINLNDYIDDTQWGLTSQEMADFVQVFWNQDQLDNRRLGIPAQRSAQVLFYNASWAEELGFSSAPTTPEEFQKQACAAAQSNLLDKPHQNDGTGGWIINTEPMTIASWINAFDSSSLTPDSAGMYQFNTPETQDAFKYLRTLFDQGCAWLSREPQPYDYFATRQALFYAGSLQDMPTQDRAQLKAESGDRWTVIPFPSISGNSQILTTGISYSILVGSPQEQLAAWLFIRWMLLPRNQVLLVESNGAWPPSIATQDLLGNYRRDNPMWGQTLLWIPGSRPAPDLPAWRTARNILSDAAWQTFQANVAIDQVPNLLQQLDELIPEVLDKSS